WHDLAALGDESLEHPDVLVVDIVDLLDAETANLLAPEVLFLAYRGGFVAASGPLRCGDRSSTSLFRHCDISLLLARGGAGRGLVRFDGGTGLGHRSPGRGRTGRRMRRGSRHGSAGQGMRRAFSRSTQHLLCERWLRGRGLRTTV